MHDIFIWHKPTCEQEIKEIKNQFPFANTVEGNWIEAFKTSAQESKTRYFWLLDPANNHSDFDFRWEPVPWESTHTHTFANQYQRLSGTVLGNRKQILDCIDIISDVGTIPNLHFHDQTIIRVESHDCFDIIDGDYITAIKIGARKSTTDFYWILDPGNNHDNLDMNWVPDKFEEKHTWAFSNEYQTVSGTMLLNKKSIMETQIMGFEDIPNLHTHSNKLQSNEQKKQVFFYDHTTDFIDFVKEAAQHSDSTLFWILDFNNDHSNFDMEWRPELWESKDTHIFSNQYQKFSYTMLVNKNSILKNITNITSIDNLPNAHYRDDIILQKNVYHDKFIIADNSTTGQNEIKKLQTLYPNIKIIDGTLVNAINQGAELSTTRQFWIIDPCNNHDNFDFGWVPEAWNDKDSWSFGNEYQVVTGTMLLNKEQIQTKTINTFNDIPFLNYHTKIKLQKTKGQYDIFVMEDYKNAEELEKIIKQFPDANLIPENSYESAYNKAQALSSTKHFWLLDPANSHNNLDFDWMPAPWEQNTVHAFGNQYQNFSATVLGNKDVEATNLKFHKEMKLTIGQGQKDIFYYTSDQDFITRLKQCAEQATSRHFWLLDKSTDNDKLDLDWVPAPWELDHTHAFGNQYQKFSHTVFAHTDTIKNNLDVIKDFDTIPNIHFHDDVTLTKTVQSYNIFVYQPTGVDCSAELLYLNETFDNVQVIENMQYIGALLIAAATSQTKHFWFIDPQNNHKNFDFNWMPPLWERDHVHAFPSEYQKYSGTVLGHKDSILALYDKIKSYRDILNLHFHDDIPLTRNKGLTEVWWLDCNNDNKLPIVDAELKTTRFFGDWFSTIKRIANKTKQDFFWVAGGMNNYDSFDFNWVPQAWEYDALHCFSTGTQEYGDTFYVNRKTFLEQADKIEKLKHFNYIHYYNIDTIQREQYPVYEFELGKAQTVLQAVDTTSDYFWLVNKTCSPKTIPDYVPEYWHDRQIHAFGDHQDMMLIPQQAKTVVKNQLYDYPHVKLHTAGIYHKPMDIVFVSYDEVNAESNWKLLSQKFPRAKRVDKVEGQLTALKQAAEMCDTPFVFYVFGKNKIDDNFKFDFQPDRLSNPKNYIFYAHNEVLNYAYGHGSILLYDREWLLAQTDETIGIDITLSHELEVIPEVSSTICFDDAWSAWRTAFRESYKLAQSDNATDKYRLKLWCSSDKTEFGKYSKDGANKGKDYYTNNPNDVRINDWSFLKEIFKEAWE